MIILPMTSPDDLGEIAQYILKKAVENPETRVLIEELINDPKPTRKQLFGTAFAMGASSALGEMMQGHIVQIGSPQSQSDS